MGGPDRQDIVSVEGASVDVHGDIDAHTAPQLAAALVPLPGTGDVVVDLSSVTFMDSSGIRVIVEAHRAAVAAGRRLVLNRPSPSVTRIIELSGLSGHLTVEST